MDRPKPASDSVPFEDVAYLINLSPTTKIEVDSPEREEPQWTLYRARHTIQRHDYPFKLLRLKSGARNEDLRAAHAAVASQLGSTDVVYPPSLMPAARTKESLLEQLFTRARAFVDTTEYFKTFLESDLEQYAKTLAGTYPAPKYYVEPVVAPGKTRHSVLEFLRSDAGVGERDRQRLGVVLAEAGQGKTYHSQYLASALTVDWRTRGRRLPIYIDSKQWSQIATEDLSSISKTIFHSFRYFKTPLAWIADQDEDLFLRTALRLGLFTVIFDGFDEYILWNSRLSAGDALDALAALAASTTARIVVTSRRSFWDSDITAQRPDAANEDTGTVFEFTLLPFNKDHARNYFLKRIEDSQADVDRAANLFSQLYDQDPAMAGRGFVLHLVADLVRKGKDGTPLSATPPPKGQDVIAWLLPALCNRERERQNLPLSAEEQLAALRELATEEAQGTTLDDELVGLAVQSASGAVDPSRIGDVLAKMSAHPLIERKQATPSRWAFTQEYVRNLLIGQHLDALQDTSSPAQIEALLTRLGATKGSGAVELVDIAEVFVAVCLSRAAGDPARVQSLIRACSSKPGDGRPTSAKLGPFVAELALGVVKRLLPSGSRAERTALLTSLFEQRTNQARTIPRLTLAGTIASFDFRGVTFDDCVFEEVTFARCDFDETTVFRQCRFVGGRDVSSSGFGKSQFVPQAAGDPEGVRWIKNQQAHESQRRYGAEDLQEDLASLLRKFVGRGGILKTIERGSLRTGPIMHSPHAVEIIATVEARLLTEHAISGTGRGYHIREEATEAMRFFATNNNFTGVLADACAELQRKLRL